MPPARGALACWLAARGASGRLARSPSRAIAGAAADGAAARRPAESPAFARALAAARVPLCPRTTGRTSSTRRSGGTTPATCASCRRTPLRVPAHVLPARPLARRRRRDGPRHEPDLLRPLRPHRRRGRRHASAERLSRGAAGLAGASGQPFRVLRRGLERRGDEPGRRHPCAFEPATAASRSTSSSRPPSRSSPTATAASRRRATSPATRRTTSATRAWRARGRVGTDGSRRGGHRGGLVRPRVEHERARAAGPSAGTGSACSSTTAAS